LDQLAVGLGQLAQQHANGLCPLLGGDPLLQDRDVLDVQQPAPGKPGHRLPIGRALAVEAAQGVVPDAQQPCQRPPAPRVVPRGGLQGRDERIRD
jgi:hypothetical protein